MEAQQDWLHTVLWIDKTHFTLSAPVNTRNCQVWTTETSHACVEVPSQQFKLTVWWLRYRFHNWSIFFRSHKAGFLCLVSDMQHCYRITFGEDRITNWYTLIMHGLQDLPIRDPVTFGCGESWNQNLLLLTGIISSTKRCHPPKCVCHSARNATKGCGTVWWLVSQLYFWMMDSTLSVYCN